MRTIRFLLYLLGVSSLLISHVRAADPVTIEWENIGSATAWDSEIVIQGGSVVLSAAHRIAGSSGSFTVPYVSGRKYIARWRSAISGGTLISNDPIEGCEGCTIELAFNGGGGPVVPAWKYDMCFTNKSNFPMVIHLEDTTGLTYTDSIRTIPAGGVTCYNLSFPTKRDIQVHRDMFRDANGDLVTTTVFTIGASDPDWYQGADNPGGPEGESLDDTFQPDTDSKTGGAVEFDTGTDPATEQTLQTGFNALHKVTIAGLSAVQSELTKVNSNLNEVEQAISSGFVNVNGTMVSVNSAVNALGTKLDATNTKLDTANTHASTQNAKLDAVNVNLDSIESGVGVLNNSVDVLETKADTQISVMISNVLATAAGFNTISNKLPISSYRLASSQDMQEIKDELLTINQTIEDTDAKTQINAVKDRIDVHGSQAHNDAVSLEGKITDIRSDGRAGTNLLGQIKSALDDVKGILSGTATNSDLGTHSRLDEIKEVLQDASINTNAVSFSPSSAETSGRAAAEEGEEVLGGIESAIGTIDGSAPSGTTAYNPIYIDVAGEQLDFNPMNLEGMSAVANWVSTLIAWISALLTVNYMLGLTLASINQTGSFNQVRFSFMNSLGFGAGGAVGAATATLIAGAISVTIGSIFVLAATYMGTGGDLIGALANSPLVSSHAGVQQGIFILLEFFPFATVIANFVLGMVYTVSLTKLMWVSQTVVRFMVG